MVHTREVVKAALTCNAATVIAVHNHPLRIAEPGEADKCITERLRDASSLVGIKILEHIIAGSGEITSLAEGGPP